MSKVVYTIKTANLLIRSFHPKDAFLLKEAIDESIDHLSEWLTWTRNEPEDIDKKIERLRINRSNFDSDSNYVFGIFNHENTKLLGTIALMKRVGDGAFEIGYWIHKNYIGRGYATEATKAVIKIAFEIYQVERIEIRCNIRNTKSMNIPKKLQFTHEATIRKNEFEEDGSRVQSMIWVLFKEDYLKTNIPAFPLLTYDVADREIII